ncbi:MAG: UDP-N-acetylglucosamine 1-carboxyvinyltransferase, partial [Desulfofustis sp. PB-SRB1]|nr:UDP-N-acetylglucosamine 1-carboxyvinyltransferase [Desulfofustis sp. PB-SRB1]
RPDHLPALLEKLAEVGVDIVTVDNHVTVRADPISRARLKGVDIKTMPYPGYPTDLQAQIMSLMCLCDGMSVIKETIFENRFMHVAELRRLGADIRIEGNTAAVRGLGPGGFNGARVMATDLRASSSLVIGGLAAAGRTEISRIYHLERGYENLVEKLCAVGARVWKETD